MRALSFQVLAVGFMTLSLQSQAFAMVLESIDTRIQGVVEPMQAGDDLGVMSTSDGRVYETVASDEALVAQLRAVSPQTPVHLTLVDDRIVAMTVMADKNADDYSDELSPPTKNADTFKGKTIGTESYVPTELATIAETNRIFDSLEGLRFKSQCFQRAQMWTYQMWRERSIKSLKVFLFFTRRHIREFRYKWWFHVAPVVHAGGTEIVLDPTFTDGPLEMRAWTDSFMENRVNCPEALTYRGYEQNQEAQHCYLIKMPMYYYQPADIESLDLEGRTVTGWRGGDLEAAKGARCRFGRRC